VFLRRFGLGCFSSGVRESFALLLWFFFCLPGGEKQQDKAEKQKRPRSAAARPTKPPGLFDAGVTPQG
jgi:hypothetical protein